MRARLEPRSARTAGARDHESARGRQCRGDQGWNYLAGVAGRLLKSASRSWDTGGTVRDGRDVVLVVSSSRGGSSVLMEMLKRVPELLHLQGETNPLLRLAIAAGGGGEGDSDELGAEDCTVAVADRLDLLLWGGLGTAADRLHEDDIPRFSRDVWWRLNLQWPLEAFDEETVNAWVGDVLAELRHARAWSPARFSNPALFSVSLLRRVVQAHPAVDPRYYDLPRAMVRAHFPRAGRPVGAPSAVIVEEPPFITIRPWRAPHPAEPRRLPILLKSPSNAYRLRFWSRFFAGARVRVLHIVRNPAASINGLIDGWLHHGFHSRRLCRPHEILGVEDRLWWKFDLPPNVLRLRRPHLVDICAQQWRAAHASILDFVEQERPDYFRIRFESLIGTVDRRAHAIADLLDWLGVARSAHVESLVCEQPPIVMATKPPRPGRWFRRRAALEPVISDPEIREVADRLGYGNEGEWI